MIKIIMASVAILYSSFVATAQGITSKDFDYGCAITSGAELGANPKGSAVYSSAFILLTFYLGRLTARDDTTAWHTVILGRVAELRENARSADLYTSCTRFYLSKIE